LFSKNKPVEVMVHPIYDDEGKITNYVGGDNMEKLIAQYLPQIKFVSFSQIS
jgi:hypothetical protein